jgi:hypothetical protein
VDFLSSPPRDLRPLTQISRKLLFMLFCDDRKNPLGNTTKNTIYLTCYLAANHSRRLFWANRKRKRVAEISIGYVGAFID